MISPYVGLDLSVAELDIILHIPPSDSESVTLPRGYCLHSSPATFLSDSHIVCN